MVHLCVEVERHRILFSKCPRLAFFPKTCPDSKKKKHFNNRLEVAYCVSIALFVMKKEIKAINVSTLFALLSLTYFYQQQQKSKNVLALSMFNIPSCEARIRKFIYSNIILKREKETNTVSLAILNGQRKRCLD